LIFTTQPASAGFLFGAMQMEDNRHGERIARLEARMDASDRRQNDMVDALGEIQTTVKQALGVINDVATQQAKWKGTVGGITLVLGGLMAVFSLAKEWVIDWARK
jgi:hypothetical protein